MIFMISGPSGRVHGPENQLYLTLDTPNCFKRPSKNEQFPKKHVRESRHIGKQAFEHFWKRRGPTNHEDAFLTFLNILNMGPISTKRHEMDVW